MDIEELEQPTVEVSQACPCCGEIVTMVPYDIGSGPELSCSSCEWCWGANGQSLKPLDIDAMKAKGMIGIKFEKCLECGKDIGCSWPDGEAPKNCTEHQ